MALHAGRHAAVLLQPLAQREAFLVGLERRHVRRRICRRLGDDLAGQPRAALHRVRFAAVRESRQDRGLRENAAEIGPAVRKRDEPEAALGLIGEVVVVGDGFVRDDEIRGNQILYRQIVPDQVLDETRRAPASAQRACRA